MNRWVFHTLTCLILLVSIKDSFQSQIEERLFEDLLKSRSKFYILARPVANDSEPVKVSMGIAYNQITDLDEKQQTLTSNIWMKLSWNDYKFKWNPEDYAGIDAIRIIPEKLWLPDILPYNSADQRADPQFPAKVLVTNKGDCTYILPQIVKTICQFNSSHPEHQCLLKFGSWVYDGFKLEHVLMADPVDLSQYTPHPIWNLVDLKAKLNRKYYPCCKEPYYDATFTATIKPY